MEVPLTQDPRGLGAVIKGSLISFCCSEAQPMELCLADVTPWLASCPHVAAHRGPCSLEHLGPGFLAHGHLLLLSGLKIPRTFFMAKQTSEVGKSPGSVLGARQVGWIGGGPVALTHSPDSPGSRAQPL